LDFLNRGYKFLRKYYCKEACVCFSFFEENCDYTDDSSFDLTRELYDKIEDAIKKLISDESFEDAIELYSYLIKNEYPATGDYGAYIKMYIGRADLYCKIKNYDAALKDYGTAIEKYAHRGGLSESFTREDFAYCCKKKGDIHQKFAGIAYIEEALVLGGTDILGIAREVMPLAEKFKKEKDFENEYKAYEAILSGAYEYDEADKDLVDDVRKRMKIVKKKIVE
jgi:tetratricopeptide (TPR) repeat protein